MGQTQHLGQSPPPGQAQRQDPPPAGAAGPEDTQVLEVPAWAGGTWPPPRLRVYANRRWLRIGVALGLAGSAGFALAAQWLFALAAALLALWCGVLWFARLPLLEFSEFGACLFLNGPYRRPFFAPWTRVGAVGRERRAGGDSLVLDLTDGDPLHWPARALDGNLERMLHEIAKLRAGTAARPAQPGSLDCLSSESSPSRP
jgi:hypothetical protein